MYDEKVMNWKAELLETELRKHLVGEYELIIKTTSKLGLNCLVVEYTNNYHRIEFNEMYYITYVSEINTITSAILNELEKELVSFFIRR